jgi:type I restriction enzyme S subunit
MLPVGWAEASFSEIASHRSGNGKLIKGRLQAAPAEGLYCAFSASGQDVWRDDYEFEGDAIVVSAVGARCGKAFRASGRWSAIANTHVVRARPGIADTDFLYLILNDENFWEKGGTAQPFVKVRATFERKLALPPLSEQRRIVAMLNAFEVRIRRARAEIDRALSLVGMLRSSSVARGTITSSFVAKGSAKPLRDYISRVKTGPFGSSVHKQDYVTGGVPLINPMHIVGGQIRPSDDVTVGPAVAERLSDFRLNAGDVIIGRRGEMGRCAVVTNDQEGFLIGTGSMSLRPNESLTSAYLQLFLSSPGVVAALEAAAVGSTMVNLNQKILLDLPIVVPSAHDQRALVALVQEALGRADRLEAEVLRARELLDRLQANIRARGLRGELVPQDPSDEPASVILERIRAEGGIIAAPKRGRRGIEIAA